MEKEFIENMRQMLQTPSKRQSLIRLMIMEIQLDLMKKNQHNISITEACEIFTEEVKDECDSMSYSERQKVILSTLKQFGFTS